MQSKQIKIQDFEMKARQFLYDFIAGVFLPETGKRFINGLPGRAEPGLLRAEVSVSSVNFVLFCHAER